MLTSLAFIFIIGMAIAGIFEHFKLPRIIGMLLAGIVIGPHLLNLLDHSIIELSPELREMALVIILLKAGISINLKDLKKVGRPAILMAILPAIFEIIAFVLFAPYILGITRLESAIIGAILGAVSPAIVVPKMVYLMENNYGTKKSIPQLILAGASLDDVFVIVLFYTFIGIEMGGSGSVLNFISIPISIISGMFFGFLVGKFFAVFLESRYKHDEYVRNSKKVILILGLSFLLISVETWIKPFFPFSGLIAVMSMASALKIKTSDFVSSRIAEKLGKVWIASEVILFVLVGSAVDIGYTLDAGFGAVFMIFLSLIFRGIGVYLSMVGTNITFKERVFCIIAYIPKATVQAVIGSIPLSLGLNCGHIALSIAVLSILITAPLGAILMEIFYSRLLEKDS